jgi:formylglycine-generating enzyme required for sulfatase activity
LRTLAVLVLLAAPVRAEQQKIAVLEFEVQKGLEIDRRTFSERVQNAARRAAPDLFVMTSANIETLVRGAGKTIEQCEGQCAVDTGRLIGADIVISGRISRVGRTYAISMQMYETASGELKGGEDVAAKTEDELLAASESAAERLLAPLAGGTATEKAPAAGARPSASAAQGVLKVISAPAGAKVSIDGDAAGATPLSVKKDAGTYVVSIELPGYAPVSRQVDLAAGKMAVVNEKLMQAAGYLDVSVSPPAAAQAARVTVDGAVVGVGKQGPYKVGAHAVRAEAAGYKPAKQSATVDNGGTTPVQLSLEALPGKLLISVNVDADCSAGGARSQASASGVTKLEVPAGAAHVVCSREGYSDASADLEVAAGKALPVKLALARETRPQEGKSRIEPKSGLGFIAIPAGTFRFQGKDKVSIKAFALGETAVTVAAYAKCVTAGACSEPEIGSACNWKTDRNDHPINCVDWNQAKAFCGWIGGRLPTDEEREYVASGGSEGRTYPWGNEEPGARACWDGEGSDLGKGNRKTTCPVGSHKAGDSKWGLHDLAGNVWEWTSSDYDSSHKVIRGGSWPYNHAADLRASYRGDFAPTYRYNGIGFRCGL